MSNIKNLIRSSNSMRRIVFPVYTGYQKFKLTYSGRKQYKENMLKYKKLNKNPEFEISVQNNLPCYVDRYAKAGALGSYFWQDLWAARLIAEANPGCHYDIGSRVDGFIAHLASFRENIKLIDIRPLENVIPGVEFIQADATELSALADDSVESISALCSLEHFGLGRYGDEIDPDACFKAMRAIKRVVQKDGNVYLSVPIGRQHLEFDAQRVFYAETILKQFAGFQLIEFSCIHARDKMIERNPDIHKYDSDLEMGGGRFGLFHF
ncbi:MAG: DUF268 domain-containing protein, partial [Ruminococcus flavefaciens]|nr:DUF268 domain-containing protein [Ruminococcus flavefaciens]